MQAELFRLRQNSTKSQSNNQLENEISSNQFLHTKKLQGK